MYPTDANDTNDIPEKWSSRFLLSGLSESNDHIFPSGKKIDQNNNIFKRKSPEVTINGFRTWSETQSAQQAMVATRVHFPTSNRTAETAEATNNDFAKMGLPEIQ